MLLVTLGTNMEHGKLNFIHQLAKNTLLRVTLNRDIYPFGGVHCVVLVMWLT